MTVPLRATPLAPDGSDGNLAAEIKALLAANNGLAARDRFGELMARHQRRACRIAFQYLRDEAEVDEAVQDAFIKVFTHLPSYREEMPFHVWFTRILVNGCLDRLKSRTRRQRWIVRILDASTQDQQVALNVESRGPSPEDALLTAERRSLVRRALKRLPTRQRTVFWLSHVEGFTSREVSAMTGLRESTVRVHLFRAIRKLRVALSEPARTGLAAGAAASPGAIRAPLGARYEGT
jgi:RNA polymerase sigma-70 factor (ECF subfamily)